MHAHVEQLAPSPDRSRAAERFNVGIVLSTAGECTEILPELLGYLDEERIATGGLLRDPRSFLQRRQLRKVVSRRINETTAILTIARIMQPGEATVFQLDPTEAEAVLARTESRAANLGDPEIERLQVIAGSLAQAIGAGWLGVCGFSPANKAYDQLPDTVGANGVSVSI